MRAGVEGKQNNTRAAAIVVKSAARSLCCSKGAGWSAAPHLTNTTSDGGLEENPPGDTLHCYKTQREVFCISGLGGFQSRRSLIFSLCDFVRLIMIFTKYNRIWRLNMLQLQQIVKTWFYFHLLPIRNKSAQRFDRHTLRNPWNMMKHDETFWAESL